MSQLEWAKEIIVEIRNNYFRTLDDMLLHPHTHTDTSCNKGLSIRHVTKVSRTTYHRHLLNTAASILTTKLCDPRKRHVQLPYSREHHLRLNRYLNRSHYRPCPNLLAPYGYVTRELPPFQLRP